MIGVSAEAAGRSALATGLLRQSAIPAAASINAIFIGKGFGAWNAAMFEKTIRRFEGGNPEAPVSLRQAFDRPADDQRRPPLALDLHILQLYVLGVADPQSLGGLDVYMIENDLLGRHLRES